MENQYIELGKELINGCKVHEIELNGKTFKFSPKQKEFISDFKSRYILYSGGYGCGKSLALYIKIILFAKCFPGNRIVLGRRTLADIERTILPDLFDLMPSSWFTHRVKDGIINFPNKSQIILFGLDALQEGSEADKKKAQQKLKSLNIGAFFIDQLEEVEYEVFNTLSTRMRRNVPFQQGNMTTNPANFWAYDYFKANPREGTKLVQGSMLDNKDNLPEAYLRDMLSKDQRWIRRYVNGEWTPDVLTDRAVFAEEHIRRLETMKKRPLEMDEGCEIYEKPRKELVYQMGIDPSEGVIDPSSISIVSSEGKKVAKWNGKIPLPVLIEKTKYLYYKYFRPLVVPEVNAAGAALLEGIKDLKIYKRRVFEYRGKKEIEKLGFKTSHQSKAALISHFQTLLRTGYPKIFDEKTIDQFKVFIWSDSAKEKGAGAQKGFHDDDVMSTLLAFWEITPQTMERKLVSRQNFITKKQFQYL